MRRRSTGTFWITVARRGPSRPTRLRNAAKPAGLDIAMMTRALELARAAAAADEVPVGAVVYGSPGTLHEGVVFAESFNQRERLADPAAHAEFVAILAAARARQDWRLNECSVAVTLEPCPMCAGLMVNARVGRVIYGADDPKAGAVRSLYGLLSDRRLNHRPVVIPHVRSRECATLLTSFFSRLREQRKARRTDA